MIKEPRSLFITGISGLLGLNIASIEAEKERKVKVRTFYPSPGWCRRWLHEQVGWHRWVMSRTMEDAHGTWQSEICLYCHEPERWRLIGC